MCSSMSVRISFARRIWAEKTPISLPPRLLASSIAWSAWFISSEAVDWPGWPRATPMLTARLTSSPPTRIGSFATCRSVSALARAAASSVAPAMTSDELVPAEPGDQVLGSMPVAQPVRQGLQELIARGVAEEAVQRLEPVDVHEDQTDRARLIRLQPFGEVIDERPAVGQVGQLVVERLMAQALLGIDARLQLGEQPGHRPQRVDLGVGPLPVAVLDETQHTHGSWLPSNGTSPARRRPHTGAAGPGPDIRVVDRARVG